MKRDEAKVKYCWSDREQVDRAQRCSSSSISRQLGAIGLLKSLDFRKHSNHEI